MIKFDGRSYKVIEHNKKYNYLKVNDLEKSVTKRAGIA